LIVYSELWGYLKVADNACSVTVVGSRARVDVSLANSLPVAELLWDLADLLREPEVAGAVPRWGLVRSGGSVLNGDRGLADQGVADGSLLFLRDLSRPPSQPVIDDYAEAVALAVEARGGRWDPVARQGVLLIATVAWVVVAAAAALRLDDPAVRALACFAGAGCLLLTGIVVGRLLDGGRAGPLLGLAGLPLAGVGGIALGVAAGLAGVHLAVAAAGFAAAAALAGLLAGEGARAPVAGVLTALGAPAVVAALGLALGASTHQLSAVLAALALLCVRFAPALAVRLERLGSRPLLTPLELRTQVDNGHGLLAAIVTGACLVMAAACAWLALEGGWFERGLVAAVALGAAAQVRHFRFSLEASPPALAALVSLGALELAGLRYLDAVPERRPTVFALALTTALILVAAGVLSSRRRLSPLLLRRLDQLEGAALLAAIPLAAGSLGLYAEVAAAAQRLA
jgi:type VII secretion integral membrane protein EccD